MGVPVVLAIDLYITVYPEDSVGQKFGCSYFRQVLVNIIAVFYHQPRLHLCMRTHQASSLVADSGSEVKYFQVSILQTYPSTCRLDAALMCVCVCVCVCSSHPTYELEDMHPL